jgi:hypothetical protein
MPGDNIITRNWGSRDDDSMSDLYTTDGTGYVAPVVAPQSQVSRAARAGAAINSGSPAALVASESSKSTIFRSSSNTSTESHQIRAPGSNGDTSNDDDSMSGIYTTDGVSVTQDERFRASVLAEERKILKEYSLDSGSGSFESYPNGLFMPTALIAAKTPSPNKKQDKNKKQKWSPFVGSVGTHDFDLDSIESDGIMRGEEERGLGKFQVLGIKARMAGSPMGTDKTRSPSTLGGGGAVLSTSYDDAFPELEQAEGGYVGRPKDALAKIKKKAAAAAAAAGASSMRPRVCRCRLEKVICILVGVMMIALAIAIGALVAAKQTRGGDDEDVNVSEFQAPTQSAPTPSGQIPTLSQVGTSAPTKFLGAYPQPTSAPSPLGAFPAPTAAPTKLKSTEGPTNSPAVVETGTASPTKSPGFVVVTQRPTAAPVTIGETQSPTAVPVAVTTTLAPGSLTVTQSPASAQPTPACLLGDVVGQPFFVSVRVGLQDCAWLAVNPVFQIIMCVEGLEANDLCRATCNNCGPTSAPITAPTVTLTPTLSPSVAVAATQAPTNAPTRAPTNAPTRAPTLSPTVTAELRLERNLILTRSPASAGALNDDTSSQSQALAWLESDPTAETLTEERLVQRWVMATLAFSLAYESWDSNDNWLDSDDVCSWFGIACNNGGNVVTLALRNNGLDGTLPSEVSLLGGTLRSLDVGNNGLTGGFPSSFGRLVNLETLRINNNAMTGRIPTQIGSMISLVVLDFQRNQFSGAVPQSIASLQNLNQLFFNTNDMSGTVPASVCDFANLVALVLDCREIECDCWTQCYYQCGGDTGIVCQGQ